MNQVSTTQSYQVSPQLLKKSPQTGGKSILQAIGQQSLSRSLLVGERSLDRNPSSPQQQHQLKSKNNNNISGRLNLSKNATNNNNNSSVYSSPGLKQSAAKMNSTGETKFGSSSNNNTSNYRSTFDSMNARTACVLSMGELQQMKDRAKLSESTYVLERAQEKARLHELSLKRVENWPDSLLTVNQRKQKERYERFEKIEQEKRLIDEEEEQFRQQQYRKLIQQANQKIFEADPRVRQFKQKVLFLEVSEERKEQMELAQEKQMMTRLMDEHYSSQATQNRQDAELEEREKFVKRKAALEKQKEELKSQLIEAKQKRIEEYKSGLEEGQVIKEKAQQEAWENEQKKESQKGKAKQFMNDINSHRRVAQEMKEAAERKERQVEEKEREEEKKKAILLEMRKQRENKKVQELIDVRDKLYASQLQEYTQRVDNEDTRIQKQIEEIRLKEDKTALQKEQELLKKKEAMKQSIQESILRKEKLQAERQEKEKSLAEQLLRQSKIIEQGDQQEKVFQQKRKHEVRNQQLAQIDQKQRLLNERLTRELEEDEALRNANEVDKRIFNTWAQQQVQQLASPGRQLNPLIKEIRNIQMAN